MAKHPINQCLGAFGLQLNRTTPRARVEAKWSPDDLGLYRRLYSEESTKQRRFYNIGAGGWKHPAWTNVDNPSEWYGAQQQEFGGFTITWNLLDLKPLDVESDSAELMYTSHVVEHVTNEADENLFKEACRILKPGGRFRITCPDISEAFAAYQRNDRDWYNWIPMYSQPDQMKRIHISKPMADAPLEQIFLYLVAGSTSELHADGIAQRFTTEQVREALQTMPLNEAMDMFTRACPVEIQKKYPGNHINWFTKEKLCNMLKQAGFSNAYVSAYGQSHAPVMRNVLYFDYRRPNMSLYVEAVK